MSENLLEVHDLQVHFKLPRRVPLGATLQGSRSGRHLLPGAEGHHLRAGRRERLRKSTTALAVMRLVDITDGRIRLGDTVLSDLEGDALRRARRDFQIIFQDPYSSLNPRTRAGDMVREPLDLMEVGRTDERDDRVGRAVHRGGTAPGAALPLPSPVLRRAAAAESGWRGRSRPTRGSWCATSRSPPSMSRSRPQILNLLQRLQQERNLTYLFISHDLGVVQ